MSKEQITGLIEKSVQVAIAEGKLPPVEPGRIELDRPKRKEHGDWATNVALAVAGKVGMNSREVATIIAESIEPAPDIISRVEVAGPGFINFHLAPAFVRGILLEIEEKKELFGRSTAGGGRKVQVEFVSANPVGPLHLGHGRWAALG
ncbi:MAG TPA: hypothetical protein VIK22_07655, partial [Candidatus Anoxymicrobiaceae bacterium]